VREIIAIAAILLVMAGYLWFDQTRQLFSDRKINLAMRAAARKAGEHLRHAQDPEAIWRVVLEDVPPLQANDPTRGGSNWASRMAGSPWSGRRRWRSSSVRASVRGGAADRGEARGGDDGVEEAAPV
jgi:hypothetical protein